MANQSNQQRRMTFFGDVQGVGFRYVASRVAGRYGVAGYVRNVPDGSVECLLEGQADEIDAFLADLAEQMSQYIRRTTSQVAPYSGRYATFEVRY
jgi:acylphosphatase